MNLLPTILYVKNKRNKQNIFKILHVCTCVYIIPLYCRKHTKTHTYTENENKGYS